MLKVKIIIIMVLLLLVFHGVYSNTLLYTNSPFIIQHDVEMNIGGVIEKGTVWGNGFYLNGYIITAKHVLIGAKNFTIISEGKSINFINDKIILKDFKDLAFVKTNKIYSSLKLAYYTPKIGDTIYMKGLISDSGIRYEAKGYVTDRFNIEGEGEYIMTNIFARGGFSGSPTFNSSNEVVGVCVAIEAVGWTPFVSDWRPMMFIPLTVKDFPKEEK